MTSKRCNPLVNKFDYIVDQCFVVFPTNLKRWFGSHFLLSLLGGKLKEDKSNKNKNKK